MEKNKKKWLRLELQFQRLTNPKDALERPHLYKVNSLSENEMIENLAILLASDSIDGEGEDVVFDSADEIMSILKNKGKESVNTSSDAKWKANEPVIVIWYERGGNPEWYLGFYVDDNDDNTVRVDHLKRCLVKDKHSRQMKCDHQWERPKTEDLQDVEEEQILSCKPVGDWIITPETFVYELENSDQIKNHFNSIYSE